MKDELTIALDARTRLSVVVADCTTAAIDLARAHLSGPAASYYLAQALAGVSLLGSECSQADETVTFRLECPGPLSGFLVEATAAGTLRGYTRKKILDDFDGMGTPKDADVLGSTGTFEVIRSIPGTIIGSGAVAVPLGGKQSVAAGLDAFFAQSLQRRVRTAIVAAVEDGGTPIFARGAMVECPPDGDVEAFAQVADAFSAGKVSRALASAAIAERTLFGKLGLPHADMRQTKPLSFACRCSAERASAMLAALPEADKAELPPQIDITCHMCGRTWTVHAPSRDGTDAKGT